MNIKTFTLGVWMTNCFVVSNDTGNCWMVDAGFDPEPMIDYIRENNLTPTQVVLTHAHIDHIAGLHQVRATFADIPIVIHEAEKTFLTDTASNLSLHLAEPFVGPDATGTLQHSDELLLDDQRFEVRHTPGHSPGGICLYHAESQNAIVGDALFAGSIGRHDFPTSNGPLLLQSIREQLLTLPDETTIYPGHGPESTIGQEKLTNPYVGNP